MKQQLIFLFITFFTLSSCAQEYKSFEEMASSLPDGTVPFIKTNELNEQLSEKENNIVILDAREKKEYKVSHIENAKYVGYDAFKISSVKNIDKSAKIVIYCSVGYRSEKIGEKLQKKGFKNVFNLYGGIFDWKNKGYSIVNAKGEKTEKIHAYNQSWGKWLEKGEKVYE